MENLKIVIWRFKISWKKKFIKENNIKNGV